MSSYTTVLNDTFESISRKVYGFQTNADLIRRANPGLAEPLTIAIEIFIPVDVNTPKDLERPTVDAPQDGFILKIDGNQLKVPEKINLRRSIDTLSVVDFSTAFEADAPGFREIFRPFSYKPVELFIGDELYFSGILINTVPGVQPDRKTMAVSCYALPSVMADCTPSSAAFPIQFLNLGLQEIATSIATPFGIDIEFNADEDTPFESVTCDVGQFALNFLTKLAKQKKLVISNTTDGKLLIQPSIFSGQPVALLDEAQPNVISVRPSFKPQQYYSSITGIPPIFLGLEDSAHTVINTHLRGVIRPFNFVPDDTKEGSVKAAVEAKMGRMFGNLVSYNIKLPEWRDPSGNLWEPNTIVKVLAPDAMIYTAYDFVIRSVNLFKSAKKKETILNVVMPGSFSGKIPETLPWD